MLTAQQMYSGGHSAGERHALTIVDKQARERLNQMLRNRNLQTYGPDEPIPMLYVLLEALNHTPEPIKTHAIRSLEHQMVEFCVSIPIDVLYGKTSIRFYPWDASPKPVPRVMAALRQIASWKFDLVPVLNNFGIKSSKVLSDDKRPKISHSAFMKPPEKPIDKLDQLKTMYKVGPGTSRQGPESIMVDLAPQFDSNENVADFVDQEAARRAKSPGAGEPLGPETDPNYKSSLKESIGVNKNAVPEPNKNLQNNDPPPPNGGLQGR